MEAGLSKDGVYLGPVPLCLSARAACGGVPFTGGRGVSSQLRYQVITDANAARETRRRRRRHLRRGAGWWEMREVQPDEDRGRVPARRVIVHQEAAACSAFWIRSRTDTLYLRLLRNVRHRPSRGGKKHTETEGEGE